MAVECPAPGCSYSGRLDAVEGHLGGVRDALHQGVVASDLTESLHGEGSSRGFWTPSRVLLGVVLAVVVALVLMGRDQGSEIEVEEEEQDARS